MATVISVEQLSKSYRLGAIGGSTLREDLSRWWAQMRQKPDPNARIGEEHEARLRGQEFWALREVSFTVKEGEILGIVGRNGAGKSTLLKILSRVTGPTSGCVKIKGRIASLLEVGTGFHPELTGRENIFLNGTILGMTKAEIRRKLDEIVAFAEIDEFIDTPVKRYSSGMYVRLAFAVAAHLEPEILIVDEVLAVGDAQFQKKCLGKMQDVSRGGRTVLFVSHNVAAIKQLTQGCLLLRDGSLVISGSPDAVIQRYLDSEFSASRVVFEVESIPREYLGTQAARIVRLCFETDVPQFKADEAFSFVITIRANSDIDRLRTSITIFSGDGTPVGGCFSSDDQAMKAGERRDFRVTLPKPYLAPGHYYCDVGIGKGHPRSGHIDYDVVPRTLQFEVLPDAGVGDTLSYWQTSWGRIIYPELHIQPASADETRRGGA